MMVMMIAITPSLKASKRFFGIVRPLVLEQSGPAVPPFRRSGHPRFPGAAPRFHP
jgi:hypothetical protein